MVDDLMDLRVFVQIVDSGSLTAAARVLGLSVKTVSRRLGRLEDAVGVPLVLRSTRTLTITEEGRHFYRRCVHIQRELDEATNEIRRSPGDIVGRLRAAVPTRSRSTDLIPTLAALERDHPRLSFSLFVTDQPVDLIGEGFDVAIRFAQPRDSRLLCQLVIKVQPLLVASSVYLARHGRPESLEDLEHHQCLCFLSEELQRTWPLQGPDGEVRQVQIGRRFESNDSATLNDALVAGMGIGLRLPGEPLASAGLEQILPEVRFAAIPNYALYPRHRRGDPRVVAFIDAYRQCMQALIGSSEG